MLRNIILALIVPCMLLALVLALNGVEEISYGTSYYTYLKDLAKAYDSWSLEIPNLPKIPLLAQDTYNSSGDILKVLKSIANFFVTIINGSILLLNFIINASNMGIKVVQYILTFIYSIKDFISAMANG